MKHNKPTGFTLIELSIVLVIIGLIAAAIVAGRELITQAQLNSVISESQSLKAGINAFKLTYGYFPGDFDNAFSYWGTDCATTAANCNGDGNESIDYYSNGPDGVESLRAWVHLSLAEIYPNDLTGVGVQCDNRSTMAGENIPIAPFGGSPQESGWMLWTTGTFPSTRSSYSTALSIGNKENSGCWNHDAAVMTPAQAWTIDKKIDDGIPDIGHVQGHHNGSTGGDCVDGTAYNVDDPDIECYLGFLLE